MARPRNKVRSGRVYLTLPEPDVALLEAYARQAGRPVATFGGEVLFKVLRGLDQDPDMPPDPQQISNVIQALRGEPSTSSEPHYRWPLEALLRDSRWWDRWYPQLCRLMGSQQPYDRSRRYGETAAGSGLNAEGYVDVLEFLFPALAKQQGGVVTWRDPNYPALAGSRTATEGPPPQPLAAVWEAVIRHVALALCALEDAQAASALILVESQLRHDWLAVLVSLTGEAQPPASPRLPEKRLV